MASEPTVIIAKEEVWRFVFDSLRGHSAPEEHASVMADLLAEADHRGHFSHGLNRLEVYVEALRRGTTKLTGSPKVIQERAGTAIVDGGSLFGPVVGTFAMRLAMTKAKESGVGWVTVCNSTHYGIAGWYSMMASKEGLIGISMTTTCPLTFPPRSKKPFMGTNPISVAAPALTQDDDFVFDGALSSVALGKVEMCNRKNQSLPTGWGVGCNGQPTNDPKEVLNDGGLTPLGGSEENGGYKGSGLGQIVEIFCALLSGNQTSDQANNWKDLDNMRPVAHCFVAIDPTAFVPNFPNAMTDFVGRLRSLETLDRQPILAPGDPERRHMDKCKQLGGIPYHPNLIADMKKLAEAYGVKPLQPAGAEN